MNHKSAPHIKTGIHITVGVIIAAAIFFSGVSVGYQNRPAMHKITGIVHKENPEEISADFNPFWTAWKLLDEKLPGAQETNDKDRLYAAIQGLTGAFGDPYTTFFPPEENTIFETEIAGAFNGIGVEIGEKDDVLTVIAPLKDTPAYRAGLKAGDKIIKIGDSITADMSIDEAISLIRGEANTTVDITIARMGLDQPKMFTITRERISLPTVDTEIRGDVFIISLYNFSAQSPELFRAAFDQYISSGYKKLVVDLRGNPGGYLDAADKIGGLFIPRGKTIVKEIGKTERDITLHTSDGPALFPRDHQLIVLVDQGSASASEILAGALSEHGIGTLVGEQTFGKGSVQEVIKLTPDTSLKITVAKWYTPNGISISESGLKPQVVIPQPPTATAENDIQLKEAIALFK